MIIFYLRMSTTWEKINWIILVCVLIAGALVISVFLSLILINKKKSSLNMDNMTISTTGMYLVTEFAYESQRKRKN